MNRSTSGKLIRKNPVLFLNDRGGRAIEHGQKISCLSFSIDRIGIRSPDQPTAAPGSPPAPSSKDKPESGPGEGEEKAAGPPRPHGPSRMPGRAGGGAVRRLPKKKPTPAPPDQTKASATRVPCIQLSFIGEIFNHRCQSSKSFLFSKHCKEKTLFLLISLLPFPDFSLPSCFFPCTQIP